MGDRFYQQQLKSTGRCPGGPITRRKNMAWTDEKRAQAVSSYTMEDPTPENSMEIVKGIAEQLGESPNGVRTILVKAGVYVKSSPGESKSSGGPKAASGGARVGKAASHTALVQALVDAGISEPNMEIIDKLTGKAAVYFTELVTKITG